MSKQTNNNTKNEEVKEEVQEQTVPAPAATEEPEKAAEAPANVDSEKKEEVKKPKVIFGYEIRKVEKSKKQETSEKPKKKGSVVKAVAIGGVVLYGLKKAADIAVTIMEAANGNSAGNQGGKTPQNYIEGQYTEVPAQTSAPSTESVE